MLMLVAFVGCDGEKADSAGTNGETPAAERAGWPTEAEAKAAIFKVEIAIRGSETKKAVYHVKDFRHEVSSVKFADQTIQRQMTYGASAITVYPVKILYTQITEYTDKPTTRVEAGSDGTWYLYKDAFGEWTGKFGS